VSPSEGLVVEGLHVGYRGRPVLRSISLTVAPRETLALLGPNGSGKTTLLRALCGLEPAEAGSIQLNGRRLDGVPTHRRGIGLLFQEPALFPGRTVEENIAYGLDLARWPRAEVDARVRELLGLLGIAALARRAAETLSGGERQRTALARTLASRPALVLLDEPFAAVDPEFRASLREEFREILRTQGVGAVHVTHDPEEALAVGDRLGLLRDGRLIQSGRPAEVVEAPVDAEAARFLGYQLLPTAAGPVAVLPRELDAASPDEATWTGVIESIRPGLGEWRVAVRLASGGLIEWRRPSDLAPGAVGDPVGVDARRPVRFAPRALPLSAPVPGTKE
jgi:thiamine transport system ATP-binding protein